MTLRLADDRPIATTPAAFRIVARVVLAQGEARGLVAFGTADDHLHAELMTYRAAAGAFARYVESALGWQLALGAPFERARIRPLGDQRHAYNTFHYVHRQDARHALDLDATREGTSLPDLVGMRVLTTSLVARVRACLPRIRRQDIAAPLVVEGREDIDLDVLADAACAAFALPNLRGRSIDAGRARRAAVHAAGRGILSKPLGECLRIGPRAVQSLRSMPPEPLAVRAVELQARLRTHQRRPK